MPFREPVVDDEVPRIPGEEPGSRLRRAQAHNQESQAWNASIDRQWLTVTEAARRAILADPKIRHAAAGFTTRSLSEELPGQAIEEIATKDPRTTRLASKAGRLTTLLGLDAIPDELIRPDIANSTRLVRRSNEVRNLTPWRRRDSGGMYRDMLDVTRRRLERNPGISYAERELVARRYRYARDAKMLGLMAELYDNPAPAEVTIKEGLVKHELPSGTRMVMTADTFEDAPDLLDPAQWESRRQIKDRVYSIHVGGKGYIMKERKTPRHTDTTKGGHRKTLTSQQEFSAARDFSNMGEVRHGDIALRWEKPLGYVEFPDGYQFCIFESESELPVDHWPKYELAKAIEKEPDLYRDEYEETRQAAKRIYAERKDLLLDMDDDESGPDRDELTFGEFAELKANYMLMEAREQLDDILLSKGYVNTDTNGHAFIVREGDDGERPALELIGFDFEYYTTDPEHAEALRKRLAEQAESGEEARMESYRIADKRTIMEAASYVMMERLGAKIPPPETT